MNTFRSIPGISMQSVIKVSNQRMIFLWSTGLLASIGITISSLGCGRYDKPAPVANANEPDANSEHPHRAGQLGGAITSFAADQFHAEAVLSKAEPNGEGQLSVYILGQDETSLHPVEMQDVIAYLRQQKDRRAVAILLRPDPLASDPEGKTSRFSAAISGELLQESLYIAIAGLTISESQYMVRFAITADELPSMPLPASENIVEQLYLTAGGLYTDDDIEANGRRTASQSYRNFVPAHDPNPSEGDLICPITKTKANKECSWIIGGQTYYFCCPPCIDEFLKQAKENPDTVLSANAYQQ